MNAGILRKRLTSIPPGHWLVALLLGAVAGGAAYWEWTRLPSDYLASSLLSYESPKQFLADQPAAETSIVETAGGILTANRLNAIAASTQFVPDADSSPDGAENSPGLALRAQMDLEQPGPGLLQVTLHGQNPAAVLSAVNAVSSALASWRASVPAASRASKTEKARPLPAESVRTKPAGKQSLASLRFQEQEMAERISELSADQQQLETSTADTGTVIDPDAAQRSLIGSKIATTKRRLEDLQQDDADDAEIAAVQQSLAGLRHQYSMLLPPPAGASRAEELDRIVKQLAQLRLQHGTLEDQIAALSNQPLATPASPANSAEGETSPHPERPAADGAAAANPAGTFSVIAWGEGPHVRPNLERTLLLWGGIAGAVLIAVLYMVTIFRRYSPVLDAGGTMKALPPEISFYGVVIGSSRKRAIQRKAIRGATR
ncbi:hypothetical protein [Silvibacterium sp.]|uniref:hypothetical protein n=1 Tax=Silvibacterium sp. TaxID=1964179 RepID=UPI0039E27E94